MGQSLGGANYTIYRTGVESVYLRQTACPVIFVIFAKLSNFILMAMERASDLLPACLNYIKTAELIFYIKEKCDFYRNSQVHMLNLLVQPLGLR